MTDEIDEDLKKHDPYGLKYNLLNLLFWAIVSGIILGILALFGD